MKTQKGITLAALIITIVVLLIIASVAISDMIDDGIISHAQNAAIKYNNMVNNEREQLDKYYDYLNEELGCEHIYNEGVVTTEPTCLTEGVKTYTCIYCRDTYTQTIQASGHAYDNGIKTTAATCVSKGVKTYTCANCRDTYTESIAALGHVIIQVYGYSPTCTEPGMDSGEYCTRPGCDYSWGYGYIPALGHEEVTDKEVEATCTETGLTEGKHCSRCGTVLVEQKEIDAKGHSFSEWRYYSSCVAEGYKTRECTACEVTEKESIPQSSHSYREGKCLGCDAECPDCIIGINPSYSDSWSHFVRAECSTCGNDYTISELSHFYTNGDNVCDAPGCGWTCSHSFSGSSCTYCRTSCTDSTASDFWIVTGSEPFAGGIMYHFECQGCGTSWKGQNTSYGHP